MLAHIIDHCARDLRPIAADNDGMMPLRPFRIACTRSFSGAPP